MCIRDRNVGGPGLAGKAFRQRRGDLHFLAERAFLGVPREHINRAVEFADQIDELLARRENQMARTGLGLDADGRRVVGCQFAGLGIELFLVDDVAAEAGVCLLYTSRCV